MTVLAPALSLPIAKYDYPWDGRIARARVLDFCKSKIKATPTTKDIDAPCAKRAFLLLRDKEPDYTREAWDLPYADVIDDRLMIVPRGVKALSSGHGVQAVQTVSSSDQALMRKYVCQLYDRVRQTHHQMPSCPFAKGSKVTRPLAADAHEHIEDTEHLEYLVAAAIADPGMAWDGAGAQSRIIKHCEGKGDSCWKQAYLVPGATPSESKFPVMDVVGGGLQVVPRAVIAAAGRLGSAKDVNASSLKGKICSLYAQIQTKYKDFPDCPLKDSASTATESSDAMTATKKKMAPYSRTAAGVPVLPRLSPPVNPPIDWFAPMETIGPVPLTIEASGRVYGHGALWDSCHAGYADRCVPVPHSMQDYNFFHRGAVETDDGSLVAVGHLTVGGGHAGPDGNLQAASEHYDDATSTVAVVSAHEDRWGIFLAGSLVPEATPEQVAMLRRSPLSGDWRTFDGHLEMVAMHGVNVPGFGVDRPRQAIAASGTLIFPGPFVEDETPEFDPEELDRRIALAASILTEGK